MIKWAFVFAAVAVIAGLLGFTGLAGVAAGAAKLAFGLCMIAFVVMLALAVMTGSKARR